MENSQGDMVLRYISAFIYKDLLKKMVFLGGPRQVGKTTLSRALGKNKWASSEYLNWDNEENRRAILKHQWPSSAELVIFDDLHKYRPWKSWIKGIYDQRPLCQQYLLTGSARLDVYKKGGDSLLGRYHYWRLHPFTLDELPEGISAKEGLSRLLQVGGFPEPFLMNDERQARRWRRERLDRIIHEDIRDLENTQQLGKLSLFVDSLRERVGGLIVLSNLAKDLQVSPTTAKNWLDVIERMYLAFSIYPLTKNIPRAILKPAKVYFYDNADVLAEIPAKIENLVATHLLKRLHFIEDYEGYRCQLHYIRDKEGREIDFAVVIDGKLDTLIEVKTQDSEIPVSLAYYHQLLKPRRSILLVYQLKRAYEKNGIEVMSITDYFVDPPWNIAID